MEGRLQVAVCDNDAFTADSIAENAEALFRKADIIPQISRFTDADQLYAAMEKQSFDLLLLDIDMPGMDGIQFSKKLREEENEIDIIFVSNYEKLVFESFAVNPFGFVRKTQFKKDFSACIEAWLKKTSKKRNASILIRHGSSDLSLSVNEILYVESFRKQQTLHIRNQQEGIVITSTMNYLESQLEPYGFLRINHGCLVNYEYIRSITKDEAVLKNGERLSVSRRRVQQVREKYFSLMRSNGNIVF